VPLPERHFTIYTRLGDWFPKACGLFAVSFVILYGVVRLIIRARRRSRIINIYTPVDVTSVEELPGERKLYAGGSAAPGC